MNQYDIGIILLWVLCALASVGAVVLAVKYKQNIIPVWGWLLDFLEYGDLVPLLVLVSAFHYAAILKDKDAPAVAISIGLLMDLGHFRTIRAAFRYAVPVRKRKRKGNWFVRWLSRYNGQLAARWCIALVMTGISLAYHQRYYGDWWLSAPLPFLIAALAWLQRVDARMGTKKPAQTTATTEIGVKAPVIEVTVPLAREAAPVAFRYVCDQCDFKTNDQRAWAGHGRKHKTKVVVPAKVNGKAQLEHVEQ